jgi:transcriptional regulator GlxA family with amidase domain
MHSIKQGLRVLLVLVAMAAAVPGVQAKTIGILVFDQVLTSDVTAPAEVFGAASRKAWFTDYKVKLINVERGTTVTTDEGLTLVVNASIHDDLTLDALVVPSAYEMDHLHANSALMTFLRRQGKQARWLASNCSGAFLLADAELLDGHRATTYSGGEDKFQRRFPKVKVQRDTNVVVDGNRVTSNGSTVSYQSALVLLGKMTSSRHAHSVFKALQMERLMDWNRVAHYLE